MDYSNQTLIIYYPSGAVQNVRPAKTFNGDWYGLAYSIAGPYFPTVDGKRLINYIVK
jgi:hypothetical protein